MLATVGNICTNSFICPHPLQTNAAEVTDEMATIKIETTVRRHIGTDGPQKHESAEPTLCKEQRDVTLTEETHDVGRVYWALNAPTHEVIRDIWESHTGEFWDDWGWYGPYPHGDITITVDLAWKTPSDEVHDDKWVTVHQLVDEIVAREDITDDKAGVYVDLIESTPRINVGHRALYPYLAAERGVDTSYYTHGESSDD